LRRRFVQKQLPKIELEYVPIGKLKGWEKNPRKISDEQRQALRKSIEHFGVVDPVITNKGFMIIGGHQRVNELQAIGYQGTVPVVRVRRDLTKKEFAALNVALNKISGDWDVEKLAPILEDLQELPILELTGFDAEEVDRIIQEADIEKLAQNTGEAHRGKPELSVIPYVGGKQSMVAELTARMPQHSVYVEVFGGAASFLLNKPRSGQEVYNDIDREMVNMLMQIRDHPLALKHAVSTIPYSRELYEKWRREYRDDKVPKDDIERAARFMYIMCTSWAGGFYKGWRFAIEANEERRLRGHVELVPKISERLHNVTFDCLDFERCIKNWDSPDTFFFLDPPYFETPENYYRHTMTPEQHEKLAELLKHVEGKWLVTYAYHPRIREVYKNFETQLVNRTISMADSHDFGGKRPTKVHNMIITNYLQEKSVANCSVTSAKS